MDGMDSDQSPNIQPTSLYTVRQAADLLGTSVEAVRSRLNRGTLEREDGEGGRVYVRLDRDQMPPDADHTDDHTGSRSVEETVTFRLMQDEIKFLRGELERKDTLLMSLMQRIPELETPPEAPGSPESASEEPSIGV